MFENVIVAAPERLTVVAVWLYTCGVVLPWSLMFNMHEGQTLDSR
jgi:hypothetical protein